VPNRPLHFSPYFQFFDIILQLLKLFAKQFLQITTHNLHRTHCQNLRMLRLLSLLLFAVAQGKNVLDVLKNRATYSQVDFMTSRGGQKCAGCSEAHNNILTGIVGRCYD
jgi:hypothetical protein